MSRFYFMVDGSNQDVLLEVVPYEHDVPRWIFTFGELLSAVDSMKKGDKVYLVADNSIMLMAQSAGFLIEPLPDEER